MKKIIVSVFYFAIALSLNAQDIEIGFRPKDSAVVIDSIRATILKTNQTVKLTGSETLTLVKTTTGIGSFPINSDQSLVYPNPCDGNATVCLSTPKSEEVNLKIFNASGQLVSNKAQILEAGQHRFSFKLPGQGIYYIAVQKRDESLNYKLVSIAKEIQSVAILYTGNEQVSSVLNRSNRLKSAMVGKTLNYSEGDNIIYTMYSGKNATVMSDTPTASKNYDVVFYQCADKDGKNYKTVTIGDQIWMAENLAYLPYTTPTSTYSNTDPCYYVYDYANYGVLYNWPAALSACPAGWHLPSDAEWTALENYLIANGYNYDGSKTENKIAKSLAATTNWNTYSVTGTIGKNLSLNNKSGFSALPAGCLCTDGLITNIGSSGLWWSSTEDYTYTSYANYRYMGYGSSGLYGIDSIKYHGFSVRCVRD